MELTPRRLRVLVLCVALATGNAVAQGHDHHDHHGHHGHHGMDDAAVVATPDPHHVGVALAVVGANYVSPLFEGTYQGLTTGVSWSYRRFAAMAMLTGYRLDKNGRAVYGVGDLMVHGQVSAWANERWSTGFILMVSAPTGSAQAGIGMGHAMLMPEAFATLMLGRVMLDAGAGYTRGLGGTNAHAEHGAVMWPLVDPMTMSELTMRAGVSVTTTRQLSVALRAIAAVPFVDDADNRLVGALRVAWRRGRFETSADLAQGLVGDPFGTRITIGTALQMN
ncbi:MAG: hypothetical protein SFX73_29140 [Kofleriaceae bacterium]|nr:hypothetical protein [Kofleriaceae bacterium]